MASSCAIATLLLLGVNVPVYYLPFFFQVSRGTDAIISGLLILALAVSNPIASIFAAPFVTRTGHYVPWMISSGAISAVGYGLLSTIQPGTRLVLIIIYQIVAGVGMGFGVQLPITAMRNVLSDDDVPIANALMVFFQSLGTALSLSGGQAIFLPALAKRLEESFSEQESARIIDMGAGNVDDGHLDADALPLVVNAYSHATKSAMYLAIAASGAAFLCSWGLQWKRLPGKAGKETGGGRGEEQRRGEDGGGDRDRS